MTKTAPVYASTILSLTPAMPNWRALFATIDPDGTWEDPVACWALVEESDGYRSVQGMIASDLIGLERAESYEDQFVRYLAPSQRVEDNAVAEEVAQQQDDQHRDRARARAEQAKAAPAPPPNGRRAPSLAEALRL